MYQFSRIISYQWNELGLALNISFDYLKLLRSDHHSSASHMMTAIITRWIESESSPVTWSTLVEALEAIGREDIARHVKDFLKTPKAIQIYSKYTDHTSPLMYINEQQ